VPAQVFPIGLEGILGSLIIPLVVGASGAVGLRRCCATSRPIWLDAGEIRPLAVGGDTRPLVATGGDERPLAVGGDTRPRVTTAVDALDSGGECRVCNRAKRGGETLCESTTVGDPREVVPNEGARLRNVSESRRRCP